MSARFAPEDYAGAARALMPRGAAWPSDPGSVQAKVLGALALALWRADQAAVALLADAFPATMGALLAEWEASLGLPDLALEANATADQRRSIAVARLVGAGGQSRARFIAFAATLGFTVTLGNYAPYRVGEPVGSALYDFAWLNTWAVHVVANAGGLSPAVLKAELEAIRPAETTVLLI